MADKILEYKGHYMYIDIRSIKLFDCLQCLSFPSMRENDKIRSISCSNYLFILLQMCEQQIRH